MSFFHGAVQSSTRSGLGTTLASSRCVCSTYSARTSHRPLSLNQHRDGANSVGKGLSNEAQLPSDLDFFKYVASGRSNSKHKTTKGKRALDSSTGYDSDKSAGDIKRTATNDDKGEGPSSLRHRVTAKGEDVPQSLSTFEELISHYDAPSLLLQNLATHGFSAPTPIQSHGIPVLLKVRTGHEHGTDSKGLLSWQKRDLAAISPTGTGKTLSYLIPIMATLTDPISKSIQPEKNGRGARAVIVAPTRELAHQIHNECLKLALGRKWRIILLSKATANTLSDKSVREKAGGQIIS